MRGLTDSGNEAGGDLVCLRAGRLYDARPFVDLVVKELSRFGGGHCHRLRAQFGQARAGLRIGENTSDFGVDFVSDRIRRLRRHKDAEPRAQVVAAHAAFADRRHIRQRARAPRGGDRNGFKFPGFHLRHNRRQIRKYDVDLPTHEVDEAGAGALVRDVHDVDAGHGL